MHTKNPKDLIRLIFPSESPTSPGCRFRLTLWERGTLSLLVSDGIHLGPNGMIPKGFHVYPEWLRVLNLRGTRGGNRNLYTCVSNKFSILITYKTIKEMKKLMKRFSNQFQTHTACATRYFNPKKSWLLLSYSFVWCMHRIGPHLCYFDSKFQIKTRFHY